MKLTASTLSGSRTFAATLVLFALANAWSWLRHQLDPACCDQEITVGFPFPFLISDGIDSHADFYVLGLLLDVVLALTLALLLARIVAVFVRPQ